MYCVINTELNDVIAMFLMKSDATDFIYKCRNPYGRKGYKVEYRKEYVNIPLSIDEIVAPLRSETDDNVTL